MRKRNRGKKNGNIALETILSGGVLFMIAFMLIGYFTYLYPRYLLDLEVQSLANEVRMDGRLEPEDYAAFEFNLKERGYTAEEIKNGTKVYAVTLIDSGENMENTIVHSDLIQNTIEEPTPIIERGKEKIIIEVTLPSNQGVLRNGLGFFGGEVSDGLDNYHFQRVVMSESYQDVITIKEGD